MSSLEIITELKKNQVVPRLEGDQLRLVGETKNLTEEFIERIKASKRELIAFLKNSMDSGAFAPIAGVEKQPHYAASNAQRRLWVLSQFEGGTAAYNIVTSLHLLGNVVRENLSRAFQACIQRHESLRTVFREVDGDLRQVVLDELPFALDYDDLSVAAAAAVRTHLKAEAALAANWAFDLETGPLIRVKLLRLPAQAGHAMIFAVHHIISDGWSIGVMVAEVLRHYEELSKNGGKPQAAAPLRIQYKDYTQWLQQRLDGTRGTEARNFWQSQFETSVAPLNLPADHARPAVKTFDGGLSKFYPEPAQYDRILTFCRKNQVTPFVFFRAALHLLLFKLSGQKDTVIGTPVSGRNHFDLENQVGLYVNTLPLRAELSGEDSFLEFLRQVSEHSFRAFEFQDYPFDKIIEDQSIRRDTGRSPLFDVMMVLQSASTGYGSLDSNKQTGLAIGLLDTYLYAADHVREERRPSKFDLTFNFDFEPGGKFYLEIEYSTRLFEQESIARFFQAYIHIIGQVLDAPQLALSTVELATAAEKHQILTAFNQPVGEVTEGSISELLAESFGQYAQHPAILTKDVAVSYAQLARSSDQIAAYLSVLLAGSETCSIGLLLGRSEWMISSILGILKAGAAYVPIDTKYPASRVEYIIMDARLPVLIVDETGLSMVPEGYSGRIIHLRELMQLPEPAAAAAAVAVQDWRERTAYLIYTSGSTGRPKGVEICHRNTIAFLKWAAEEFAHTPFEVLYAATSYCFDLSVFEFFFPLLQGKTIRLLDSALEIPEFVDQDEKILLNTVPSVVRNLLDQKISWRNVVALNMAGEPIPRRIKEELNYRRIETRNLYGPTEDTTYSTFYRFEADDYPFIPIGRAVGYTQLYLLDEYGNLVPEGVEGEIYLSGQSVAKGYFRKPELTAERFLANPWVPGLTMYRTGDMGKWLPDGIVAFGGRKDDQVKVRGYRIELGEIQYQLELHPQVATAVVVVREMAGEHQIVTYWMGDVRLTSAALKEYLGSRLPAYMVPTYWVVMDEVPLNSNGKVDKARLPDPVASLVETSSLVPPTTEEQRRLLAIWQEVLHVPTLGITQNFFEMGGDSLKATRLRSLILKEFGKKLTLNEVFASLTIEAQMGLIAAKAPAAAAAIQLAKVRPYYPISFSQERLWVLTGFGEASAAYHMPAAFRVQGPLDLARLETAFRQVITRHESLRTVFDEREGHPVQVIMPAAAATEFSIEEIHLDRVLTAKEEEDFLREKWQQHFDLAKGPLLSCLLLTTQAGQVLSFHMHHLVSDGWSVGVLYQDVVTAYQSLMTGGSGSLPPLELQYKDYAVWQRGQLTGERLGEYNAFWQQVFADGVPTLELATDFHRPEVKTYQGSVHSFQFSPSVSRSIRQVAAQSGVTLFTILMTGVKVLLKKYANQNDIVVGTPVAGREQHQLHDQIGFYVNTLPIRTRLTGEASFAALVEQENEAVLQAFEFQAYPFELLVESLGLKRDLSRSPLFDVMVVLQNIDERPRHDKWQVQPDLRFLPLSLPSGTAKYDLTFSFEETANGLALGVEYNTSLFKKETVARMTVHLARLFTQVAAQPAIAVKDISLLDTDEVALLASKADQTPVPYDATATIVGLFDQAVQAHPERTALVVGGQQLSFRDLDTRSGQLARQLVQEHEVQPEDLVVLHFSRSEEMIIAILAVLKAGAAYVPIDPDYPAPRINYIIEDSGSRLVLHDIAPQPEVRAQWANRVFVDTTQLNYSGAAYCAAVQPGHLAYVIYTSGTTGLPKGVLIEHRNVTRLLFNEQDRFDFTPDDRWSLFHSYCFDFSVWEMYGALLKAGTVVMVPKEVAQDSAAFYDFLHRENITVLNQTPTAFRSLVQTNQARLSQVPLRVRYLIFGGEALMPAILREWYQAFPDCRIINMYGITETTVHVTYKEITLEEIDANRSNVGLPIPTLSCYILDQDLQQVPMGVIGELCVGGAGVARGYLNKPALTRERFIDHPSGAGKLYRSGDYARILPSGDIEYIGRKDDQVKIRGHRIELAEVEKTISGQPGVADVVVLPTKNLGGEVELAAYFIHDESTDAARLRRQLKELLPAYMVPAFLLAVPAFPLNSNGKLDKAALPRPEAAAQSLAAPVPYRNSIDQHIIRIWEEVLERDNIGIQDNFFDLGGHSLKATRVISRIHEVYGVKIDLKNLFIDPTIEHLSNYVETVKWMENRSEVVVEGQDEIIL
ncbi:non-ribosomal peptide synthetase [Hymenobacter rubripertinctus]|uniref:Amino acid adenylation domain-containing protein n=1 Tax=Hymenobacter rubripertinctus TaxID=2029981 RepID=A0A418QL81_9BACT|nr:non-ribosomal peptide synthetase [Hymenobacter rubripertinctus]RIY05915.1 amino acid adenylation domain-containing protein [Hymenobacter rubripertinctus]